MNLLLVGNSGPPLNVTLKSHGKTSLDVSWKVPDENLQNSEVTGYQVCYTKDTAPKCLVVQGSKVLSRTLYHLQPSTKYFVTVSAITKAGYGVKSLEVSKITNGGILIGSYIAQLTHRQCIRQYFCMNDLIICLSLEAKNPIPTCYYALSLDIPKQKDYIRYVFQLFIVN